MFLLPKSSKHSIDGKGGNHHPKQAMFLGHKKKTHRVTQVHINIDQPTTIDGITYELLLRQLEDLDTHLSF